MALGAVKKPGGRDERLRGIQVATLSDAMFAPHHPQVGLRLLAAAETACEEMGAEVLLCTASHDQLRSVLTRRSFIPLRGRVHLLVKPPASLSSLPPLERWWSTRADGAADDAL